MNYSTAAEANNEASLDLSNVMVEKMMSDTSSSSHRRSSYTNSSRRRSSNATSASFSSLNLVGHSKSRYCKAMIVDIKPLTSDIKLVVMYVNEGELSFQAGQFIGVYDGRKQEHDRDSTFPGTYSIASPPCELPIIRFAVGQDQNPRSLRHYLYNHAPLGAPILLDNHGSGTVAITPRLVNTPVGGPGGIMLIGGGSAVMGLVSVVEELLHQEQGRNLPSIKLFHSNRSNEDIPFYDRMHDLANAHDNFDYMPFITGDLHPGEECMGYKHGRIARSDLANFIPGIRLFCVCGSGVFCEAIVSMLLDLGVWPGSIRTDYTTRVDPSRRLVELSKETSSMDTTEGSTSSSLSDDDVLQDGFKSVSRLKRFSQCADGTQEKGGMVEGDEYLKTYGLDVLLNGIVDKLVDEKPEYPLSFVMEHLQRAQEKLPEVNNIKAADPNFWINYWETDCVTWQAPVVSPWLEKHLEKFTGGKKQRIFVPLCGKSLDMKLLLDAGHAVVGAECSGIACSDFFVENKIPDYVAETIQHPKGKRIVCHRSKSRPIELFEGDIFDLTPEIVGRVDRILDRAALVALHPSMIEDQYLPLLTSLLKKDGKMLFASVSELPFPKAPPHAYQADQIERILSPFFEKIKLLETHRYRVNAGHVSEPIYLLNARGRSKNKKRTTTTTV